MCVYITREIVVAVLDEGSPGARPARMDDPETKGATLDN